MSGLARAELGPQLGGRQAPLRSAADWIALQSGTPAWLARPEASCLELPDGLSACFAPGTSEDHAQAFYAWHVFRVGGLPYSAPSRWTQTATNGTTSGAAPITLTYSFVADYSTGSASTSNTIHATLDSQFGSRQTWKNLFADIFAGWSAHCGITFVEVSDDGASWPGSAGVLGTRADIRITSFSVDGQYGVLAYAYTPNVGDMALDNNEYWADSGNNYRFLRNTLLHELGHSIGLLHVNPRDGTKLMEALLNTSFEGPQDDDIRGALSSYGDASETNETAATARSLGTYSSGTTHSRLALHANSDNDWFVLNGVSGAALIITATPSGASYSVSPDPGTPAATNTAAIHPLRVEAYAAGGATLLASAAAAAGQAAQTASFQIPSGESSVWLRVYTTSSTNGVQRYALNVSAGSAILRTLTLTSAPAGAAITLSPADSTGQSSATAPATRTYSNGATVALTAPATLGTAAFVRWRLDGAQQTFAQRTLSVPLEADRSAEAEYTTTLAVSAGADQTIVAGDTAQLSAALVGGTGPFAYAWSPSAGLSNPAAAAPSANPAQTTTYTLTVTDAAGHTASDAVTISVAPGLSVAAGEDRTVLANRGFTLSASAAGGTAPYTYSWSPAAGLTTSTAATVSGAIGASTTFTVTATDAAGRTATDQVEVLVADPLQVRVSGTGFYVRGQTIALSASATGGAVPIRYSWTPGGQDGSTTTPSISVTPSTTTTYTVTIEDALQQRAVVGVRVDLVEPLTVNASASAGRINGGDSVELFADTTGGLAPLTYQWSPAELVASPNVADSTAAPVEATTFTVLVTDRLGQSASGSVTVEVGGVSGLSPALPAIGCGAGVGPLGLMTLLLLAGGRKVGTREGGKVE